jgi:hypothetical protein
MIDLQTIVDLIMQRGPDRIVINADQEAVSSRRAWEEYNITPDVIFIRHDGWSLGARKDLAAQAFGTWSDSWVAFMEKPNRVARPISEYKLG